MARAKRAYKSSYKSEAYGDSEGSGPLSKINQAKANDVDYSKEFKQIGFLGHLGPIKKHKSHTLKVVPKTKDEGEADNTPLLVLGAVALILALAVVALVFMGLPGEATRFRP